MDIKKLQALVIDALEDVKAQDIKLFDTVHMTSLFDRLVVASGTSNRQTKALAASVRDKVKSNGGDIVSIEGEDTGEWVLVDLGDMIVHIMQPAIRAYYRLEEIWGDKEVSLSVAKRGAKEETAAKKSARKSAAKEDTESAAKRKAPTKSAAKKAPAKKAAAKTIDAPAKKAAAKKVAAKAPAKSAAKSAVKSAVKPAGKTVAKKATTKTAAKAPAKKAAKK